MLPRFKFYRFKKGEQPYRFGVNVYCFRIFWFDRILGVNINHPRKVWVHYWGNRSETLRRLRRLTDD